MDLVGHHLEHVLEELPGRLSVSCRNELGNGELGSAVDADEEKELAFGRLHFGNVDVKEPDGRLNFCRWGLSPATSGRREKPCC